MEFSYNYQNGKEEMICRTYSQELDRECHEIIFGQCQQWFLPFQVREESGSCIFIYNIADVINLKAWLYRASEEEQRRMRVEIMETQRKIFEMGIAQEQLLTQDRYMYVDKRSQHIKFVCIPIKQNIANQNIEKVNVTDQRIIKQDIETFQAEGSKVPLVPPVPSADVFDIDYKIPELDQPEIPETSRIYEGQEQSENLYHTYNKDSLTDNPSIFPEFIEKDEGEKTVFGFMQKPNQLQRKNDINTELFKNASDDEDKTVLLKFEEHDDDATVLLKQTKQPSAFLHRKRTDEKIRLNNSINIIGRNKCSAGIWIENAPTIGRIHCRIYYEDGNYYLEDNDSLNGTYLENERLKSGERKILQNQNKIRLSDEDFIFQID